MEEWTLSVCDSHPLRLSQGAWDNPSVPGCLRTVLGTAAGWKCCGMSTPGSTPPARTLGNWVTNIQAPSSLGWARYKARVLQFPGFPRGITLQLPTGVAASARAPSKLPLLGVTFPHPPGSRSHPNTPKPLSPCLKVCPWENRSETPAAEKMAQGLKVDPASSWLRHVSRDFNPSQFHFN